MPGFLIHVGASVSCLHTGKATPAQPQPNPRVLVSGQQTVLITTFYKVTRCTLPSPPTGNGPCVGAKWSAGTRRVTSNGLPLLISSSQAICTPTETPLLIGKTQSRVFAV